ncbi:MAG: hypothetical protein ACI9OJ_000411 [Myxococcota bacterium]|jgi:hypothetical protein
MSRKLLALCASIITLAVVSQSASAACNDGVQDGAETGIDCGGPCFGCIPGNACNFGTDCASGLCVADICISDDVGCADGVREGFASVLDKPDIAGCGGGWSVPGLLSTTSPACGMLSGDDGANPTGAGCNIADLCAPGWHVCESASPVGAAAGAGGCAGIIPLTEFPQFFATRQSGPGGTQCGNGANDLFGCGNIGGTPDALSCGPLDRFSGDLCGNLPSPWACGTSGVNEANAIVKPGLNNGGALCCRDTLGTACDCLIDGACHAAGAASPANSCLVCQPGSATDDWSPSAGSNCAAYSCSDGETNGFEVVAC